MWPMREARMSLSASHSAMARNRKKEMSVRMEMTEEAQLVMMHRYSAEGEGGVYCLAHDMRGMRRFRRRPLQLRRGL
jgi:hypothetical protein